MAADDWAGIDHYLEERLLPHDALLDAVISANRAAGLQAIDVSPLLGRYLELLVRITGARRILEIGTLGGYSAICMARALPSGGTLETLEVDPETAAVACGNIAQAGLAETVRVHVGPALETLETLSGPYDFIFIDADKRNNARYLERAVALSRPGTVILVDNVVRAGALTDPAKTDPHTAGNRSMFEALRDHPRLEATALQTVGVKGWDGFMMARVRG